MYYSCHCISVPCTRQYYGWAILQDDVTGRVLSTKVNIELDFGDERKLFAGDTRLRDDLTGKLKKFNSTVDALNYMGAQGWVLVNAFPMKEVDSFIYHYYFKKLFKKSEIN